MNNDKMVNVRLTRGDLCRLMLFCVNMKWEFLREADLKDDPEVKLRLLSSAAIYDELHGRLEKARDSFDEKEA